MWFSLSHIGKMAGLGSSRSPFGINYTFFKGRMSCNSNVWIMQDFFISLTNGFLTLKFVGESSSNGGTLVEINGILCAAVIDRIFLSLLKSSLFGRFSTSKKLPQTFSPYSVKLSASARSSSYCKSLMLGKTSYWLLSAYSSCWLAPQYSSAGFEGPKGSPFLDFKLIKWLPPPICSSFFWASSGLSMRVLGGWS